jgi:hypothetical protein
MGHEFDPLTGDIPKSFIVETTYRIPAGVYPAFKAGPE